MNDIILTILFMLVLDVYMIKCLLPLLSEWLEAINTDDTSVKKGATP